MEMSIKLNKMRHTLLYIVVVLLSVQGVRADNALPDSMLTCQKALAIYRLMQENPNWTIASVAEACGMNNTVTFNRTFRQTYGMTPTEYMKNAK